MAEEQVALYELAMGGIGICIGAFSIALASGLRDIYWLKYSPLLSIGEIVGKAGSSIFVSGVVESITKCQSVEMEKFYQDIVYSSRQTTQDAIMQWLDSAAYLQQRRDFILRDGQESIRVMPSGHTVYYGLKVYRLAEQATVTLKNAITLLVRKWIHTDSFDKDWYKKVTEDIIPAGHQVFIRGKVIQFKNESILQPQMIFLDIDDVITDKKYLIAGLLVINSILIGLFRHFYKKKQRFIERINRINSHEGNLGVNDACIVCLTLPRDVLLLPCKHYCVCTTCILEMDKCPICRQRFQEIKEISY